MVVSNTHYTFAYLRFLLSTSTKLSSTRDYSLISAAVFLPRKATVIIFTFTARGTIHALNLICSLFFVGLQAPAPQYSTGKVRWLYAFLFRHMGTATVYYMRALIAHYYLPALPCYGSAVITWTS